MYSYRNLKIAKSSSFNQAGNSKFTPKKGQELGAKSGDRMFILVLHHYPESVTFLTFSM